MLLWFVAQWLVIPAAFLVGLAWNGAMFFGGGTTRDRANVYTPLAWFLSPGRVAMECSRAPERWERHLTAELERVEKELSAEKFSLYTKIRYAPRLVPVDDERLYAYGARVHVREYRGLSSAVVTSVAARCGLVAAQSTGRFNTGVTLVLQDRPNVKHG